MIYRVHNTGEWVRSNDLTSATRTKGSVLEYSSLEEMDSFDRDQFEFMLEKGFVVLNSGNTFWTVNNDA